MHISKGLALSDIISELHNLIVFDLDLPPNMKIVLLKKLANLE